MFIALMAFEYHSLVTAYFSLAGVHLSHVWVGTAVLAFPLARTRRMQLR